MTNLINWIKANKLKSVLITLLLIPVIYILYMVGIFGFISYIDRYAYDTDYSKLPKPLSTQGLPPPETDVPVVLPPDPDEAAETVPSKQVKNPPLLKEVEISDIKNIMDTKEPIDINSNGSIKTVFQSTGLNGKYISKIELKHVNCLPYMIVSLDSEGTKLMRDVTIRNLNKTLLVTFNGKYTLKPVIRSVISDGIFITSGDQEISSIFEYISNLKFNNSKIIFSRDDNASSTSINCIGIDYNTPPRFPTAQDLLPS